LPSLAKDGLKQQVNCCLRFLDFYMSWIVYIIVYVY
jgi:hypothetical protein